MKVLGRSGLDVIVQMTRHEWFAIGGKMETDSWNRGTGEFDARNVPDVPKLVESLKKIKDAAPRLKSLRAAFQTFLMLTEPEDIQGVLDECGVAETVVEIELPEDVAKETT